jgi:hypothetical protein
MCKDLQLWASKVRDFFSKVFLSPNMEVQIKRHRVKDITKMETEQEAVPNRTTKREFHRCFQQ